MLMPLWALAATGDAPAKWSALRAMVAEKATPTQVQMPAKIRLNVPHKQAYAWATRERDGKKGLVSFFLDTPKELTLLHAMENSAFAGTHGTGSDYFFFRYQDDPENGTLIPLAFSKVDVSTGAVTDVASWSTAAFICNDMTYDFTTGYVYALCRAI